MGVGWKIFAFIFGFTYGLDIILSLFSFKKLSVGDWIDTLIVLVLGFAVFVFAFRKTIFTTLIWKIIFWIIVAVTILQTVYVFTPITFLSNIFLPEFKMTPVFNLPLAFKIISLILGFILFYIPAIYAVFFLAYKKYTSIKVVKENKDAPYSQLSVASIILGLSGLVLGPLLTIPALITGIMALRNISKGKVKGIAFAWTGITIFVVQTIMILILGSIIAYFVMLPGLIDGYESAVKRMSKDELQYYNTKLSKIKQNTTVEEVNVLLGDPSVKPDKSIDGSYQYRCPEEFVVGCTVIITITDHVVSNVLWVDYGRFFYNRIFTESDKTYTFGSIELTLTLDPGWYEYEYTEKDLKDLEKDPPLTFTRNNGKGALYVYNYDLTKDFDFDAEIREFFKGDMKPKASDIKKYSLRDWKVYEFRVKRDNDFQYFMYLVKPHYYFYTQYYYEGKSVPMAELEEAINIVKTFDSVVK